jgi:hypothetical protein
MKQAGLWFWRRQGQTVPEGDPKWNLYQRHTWFLAKQGAFLAFIDRRRRYCENKCLLLILFLTVQSRGVTALPAWMSRGFRRMMVCGNVDKKLTASIEI